MWPNSQFPADLVIFTEEILNGKLHFMCSVKNGKGILLLKVDNEYDWNRTWYSELDVRGICSYAARYSVYNNIEHTWSLMSRRLVSVTLPSGLKET